MGLAPNGAPKYNDLILEYIADVKADGSFWLDQGYFKYMTGLTMTTKKFHDLFVASLRKPEQLLEQGEMDPAASAEAVTEEIMLRITRNLTETCYIPNLCPAGGVALNCVADGKVPRNGQFKNV